MSYLVYSKDGCKYCTMATDLLVNHRHTLKVVKLQNVAELKDILFQKHGIVLEKYTFPQVFFENSLVGGYSDLEIRISEDGSVFDIDEDCF